MPSDDRAQYPSAHGEFNMAFPFRMCFVSDKAARVNQLRGWSGARHCPGRPQTQRWEKGSSAHQRACGADQNTQPGLKEGGDDDDNNNTACFAFQNSLVSDLYSSSRAALEPAEQLLLPAAARRAFTPLHNACVCRGEVRAGEQRRKSSGT